MLLCIVSACCPTGCGVPVVILQARSTQTLFCYCEACGCAWANPDEAQFEAGLNEIAGIAKFAPAGVNPIPRSRLVQPAWLTAVIGELPDSAWGASTEVLNATIAADGGSPSTPDVTNDSWVRALALYDSLQQSHWDHIPPFRELVAELGRSAEAAGLTAVTSHATLLVSPYTRYPDWFDGRHVRIHPLSNGHVRISRHPERFDRQPTESWTLPLADVRIKALALIAEL
jgi:hypothetical protein